VNRENYEYGTETEGDGRRRRAKQALLACFARTCQRGMNPKKEREENGGFTMIW
jgi:hypothetical protein